VPKTCGRKGSVFKKWCWENWMSIYRRLKVVPYFWSWNKINSKWIKDLKVRPEHLKLLQEKVEKTHDDTGISNDFLNSTPIAQEITARTGK
jgi:hypothetical protein